MICSYIMILILDSILLIGHFTVKYFTSFVSPVCVLAAEALLGWGTLIALVTDCLSQQAEGFTENRT